MSLGDAHAFAFGLATTLMAAIIGRDGMLSVMPASQCNGDTAAIVHEINPFAHNRGEPAPHPAFRADASPVENKRGAAK